MKSVGIFYGSTTGNTESAAKMIQKAFGSDAEIHDVSSAKAGDLEAYVHVIFGSSTWGIGDLQDDFDSFLGELDKANLEGKQVAIFGCGDQASYGDSYVDAIGKIYAVLCNKGCEIVGKTSTDGYTHVASEAETGGQFVGLALDEDNQGELTKERITAWVEQLKNEFK